MLCHCSIPIIVGKCSITLQYVTAYVNLNIFITQLKVYINKNVLWLLFNFQEPQVYDKFNTLVYEQKTLVEYIGNYIEIEYIDDDVILGNVKDVFTS